MSNIYGSLKVCDAPWSLVYVFVVVYRMHILVYRLKSTDLNQWSANCGPRPLGGIFSNFLESC